MNSLRKRIFGLGVVLFLLAMTVSCDKAFTAHELGHPLSDKIGFSVTGRLEDKTTVSYKIKRRHPLSFQPMEEVIYRKNGHNILLDFDADGKVDRVMIATTNELIGRDLFGLRLRYNKGIFTEAAAREIIHDADRIFNRVKVALNVNEKIAVYRKSVKNPFR